MDKRDSIQGKHGLRTAFTATLCAAILSSCAMKRDIIDMQDSNTTNFLELESRLSSIEFSIDRLDSLINEQTTITQGLRAEMGVLSRTHRDDIDMMSAQQEEINFLLQDLKERIQAVEMYGGMETKPSVPQTPAPSTPTPQPAQQQAPAVIPSPRTTSQTVKVDVKAEDLYESALKDIENKNYALAESRFMSFLLQFPTHDLASNAQYWLGEAAYGQGKYDLAIQEFENVRKEYPNSPKSRAALLKIGYAQISLGNRDTGVDTLKEVIRRYSNTEEAQLAREKLTELNAQ